MEKIHGKYSLQRPQRRQQDYYCTMRLCCLSATIFVAITISIATLVVAFATMSELRDPALVLRINLDELLLFDSTNTTTTDGITNFESFKLALNFIGDHIHSTLQKATEGTTVTISKEAREAASELMRRNRGRLRVDVGVDQRESVRVADFLTTVGRVVANSFVGDERMMIRLLLVISWGCFFWNLSIWVRLSSYVDPASFWHLNDGDHV